MAGATRDVAMWNAVIRLVRLLVLSGPAATAGLACGDASVPGDARRWLAEENAATETTTPQSPAASDVAFGWRREVTVDNFRLSAATKFGTASDAIEGNTLRAIVTSADVRVRPDDKSCVGCHAWASSIDREAFCARVRGFLAQPTAKDDGTDPQNAKPEILKVLFSEWRDAGCPN